jgi:hypothetical protein
MVKVFVAEFRHQVTSERRLTNGQLRQALHLRDCARIVLGEYALP